MLQNSICKNYSLSLNESDTILQYFDLVTQSDTEAKQKELQPTIQQQDKNEDEDDVKVHCLVSSLNNFGDSIFSV